MPDRKKTLPGVLLIILSTLGIFVSLIVIGLSLASFFIVVPTDIDVNNSEDFLMSSIIILAIVILIINFFTLRTAYRSLRRKAIQPLTPPSKLNLLIAGVIWILVLIIGYYVSQNENLNLLLSLLTVAAVIIPIWVLINVAGFKLPRSTPLREQGTLTIGLIASPPLILAAEMIFILIAVFLVLLALGFNNNLPDQLPLILQNLNGSGGISEFEVYLYDLMQEPLIALSVFITLGIIAPLIEEIFKPMAIWFLLNRPLEDHEGYIIGLISGGAFALLETAGLVIQIAPEDWLAAVVLRAATSVMHIGLSGLVGYGFARSWTINKQWRSILYLLAAAMLHGAWNSIAIYSGFAAIPLTNDANNAELIKSGVFAFILMGIVFISLILINFFINRSLRKNLSLSKGDSPELIPNEI